MNNKTNKPNDGPSAHEKSSVSRDVVVIPNDRIGIRRFRNNDDGLPSIIASRSTLLPVLEPTTTTGGHEHHSAAAPSSPGMPRQSDDGLNVVSQANRQEPQEDTTSILVVEEQKGDTGVHENNNDTPGMTAPGMPTRNREFLLEKETIARRSNNVHKHRGSSAKKGDGVSGTVQVASAGSTIGAEKLAIANRRSRTKKERNLDGRKLEYTNMEEHSFTDVHQGESLDEMDEVSGRKDTELISAPTVNEERSISPLIITNQGSAIQGRPAVLPGAFHGIPTNIPTRSARLQQYDSSSELEAGNLVLNSDAAATAADRAEDILLEAQVVDDTELIQAYPLVELPLVELNQNEELPPRIQSTTRQKWRIGLALIFLIAAVIIVLVVVTHGNSSGATTVSPITSPAANTTISPTEPTPTLSPTGTPWIQIGQALNGKAANDNFGWSVAISGDGTIVVGGARTNDDSGTDSGLVQVYQLIDNQWETMGNALLGLAIGDNFGWALDISRDGRTLAVGANYNDASGTDAGSVRVFQFISGEWQQVGQNLNGPASGDWFGHALALSSNGTILAVGAQFNDNNGFNAGLAQSYQFDGNQWQVMGNPILGEVGDHLGAVKLSNDGYTLAVGADLNDNGVDGTNAGHVRVFEFDGADWQQSGLDLRGSVAYSQFGYAIAMSGDGKIVAGGAYNGNEPYVQVYSFQVNKWQELGSALVGNVNSGDRFGNLLDLSNDGYTLVVGAPGAQNGTGPGAGYVRVFRFIDSQWHQVGQDLEGVVFGDQFGDAVALSSDGMVFAGASVGNDYSGRDAGNIRVFSSV